MSKKPTKKSLVAADKIMTARDKITAAGILNDKTKAKSWMAGKMAAPNSAAAKKAASEMTQAKGRDAKLNNLTRKLDRTEQRWEKTN